MNLYKHAKSIAEEALEEAAGSEGYTPQSLIQLTCAYHDASVYYRDGIAFCNEQDTDKGAAWLDEGGGIAYTGDTFGAIACRLAFATLCVAALKCLDELLEQQKDAIL